MSQNLEDTEVITPTLESDENDSGGGAEAAASEEVAVELTADAPAPAALAEAPAGAQDSAAVASSETAPAETEPAAAAAAPGAESAAEPATPEAPAPEGEATAEPQTEATSGAELAAPTAETETDSEAAVPEAAAEAPATEEAAAEPAQTAVEAAAEAPETVAADAEAEEAEDAEPETPVEDPPEVAALRAAKESKTPIEGKVIGWNRGGFHVAIDEGITAFCPNSEMELGRPKEPAAYIDRTFSFLVLKVQKRGRRVVLSRSGILGELRGQRVAELRAQQAAGQPVPGRVSSLTDFGAFIDIGGVEGLVHVSEISRRRVNHPGEALQIGQEVVVKVLKIDQAGERVSLSIKALEPDPWEGAAERYQRGARFTGKVARKTEFGLFVELEADIDGLIHVSRLPPGTAADDPSLAIGETVEGWVREIDLKRKRISLSLREIPDHDPWDGAAKRYSDGTVIQGTVESTAPFGVFITLEPGLTGLLPSSEMQVPRGSNPNRVYAPGQKVAVQVVGIDPRRKRISLAKEGSKVEGSRSDYQSYLKQQQKAQGGGMGALAAALSKLKGDKGDEEEAG